MQNKAMERKLKAKKALDVSLFSQDSNGYYLLPEDIDLEGVDFCNAKTEEWIWSIGKRLDGQIIASTAGDLYQMPGIECLWLR